MHVTDLDYNLENFLIKKLNLIVKRVEIKDALIIVEGSEGDGKTNASIAIAYYLKYKTKRDIHMFFRLQNMIEFAKSTEKKIIIWDEPALDSLSTDWFRNINKDLIRLLMTCRKKKHIFIFNFVKFYKFAEYIVVDRALALIHVYTRNQIEPGRFVYIRQKMLEKLFVTYRNKKIRSYKNCMLFGGWFPLVEKHVDNMGMTIENKENATLEDYERLKDRAIESIGEDKKKTDKWYLKYQELRYRVATAELPVKERAKILGRSERSVHRIKEKVTHLERIDTFRGVNDTYPRESTPNVS